MGELKKEANPGEEEILSIKKLVHQKNNETKALKKLLKALEEDGNKTIVKTKTTENEQKNY
jgi:hypothetical protein